MAGGAGSTGEAVPAVAARHRYYPLRVLRVVTETAEARSIAFDVPSDLTEVFAYKAGQFVTLRLPAGGGTAVRSYSMSSSPVVDAELRVTVKRVPGGLISNWLHDTVGEGQVLDVLPPAGTFVLDRGERDIVAFAAGSGITPVFSIVRTALVSSARRVHLLYANRDRPAAIFGDELDALVKQYPGRLVVEHHEDVARGFVGHADVARVVGAHADAVHYVCGPAAFMDVVAAGLRDTGVSPAQVHIERFTPLDEPAAQLDPAAQPDPDLGPPPGEGRGVTAMDDIEVTIKLGGRTVTTTHRRPNTLLATARFAGLRPPSSCETGSCATCMARIVQGGAEMRINDALTPDEVAEGWVLTCQAVPTTPVVEVVYE
ncbi:ferredoxin--NADP reductase [Parafrankia discariae]|uniref:ferredoxin--NADP reductase n=1 Tax=Parafrankia discariae TaxID=365528 RepID=UPI0006875D6B|nr:ferredoxin--NADP reductase [Parafrankia discariae]